MVNDTTGTPCCSISMACRATRRSRAASSSSRPTTSPRHPARGASLAFIDLADDVDDRSVAIADKTDDPVKELERLGLPGQRDRPAVQLLDPDHGQPGIQQPLGQLGMLRIDGNPLV